MVLAVDSVELGLFCFFSGPAIHLLHTSKNHKEMGKQRLSVNDECVVTKRQIAPSIGGKTCDDKEIEIRALGLLSEVNE